MCKYYLVVSKINITYVSSNWISKQVKSLGCNITNSNTYIHFLECNCYFYLIIVKWGVDKAKVHKFHQNQMHTWGLMTLKYFALLEEECLERLVISNIVVKLRKFKNVHYLLSLDILFSSNHNIHKSLCGLRFWASDPLTERLYYNQLIKGSEAQKQRPHELLWMLWFDKKKYI